MHDAPPDSLPVVISRSELHRELRARPGLIPVSIDVERSRLLWRDLGRYHCYESFFRKSLEVHRAITRDTVAGFVTDVAVLREDWYRDDAVPPSGFIFHAGRSRSTLLSRSLARSRENLVLSEPAPLGQILDVFGADPDAYPDCALVYRNLVLAMCRRRLASYRRSFIKFASYNVRSFALIRAAFPEVPAIFLVRDVAAIAASFRWKPPGWAREETDFEECVRDLIHHADSIDPGQLRLVDHASVSADGLAALLKYFDYSPGAFDLARMQHEYAFDPKRDFSREPPRAADPSKSDE